MRGTYTGNRSARLLKPLLAEGCETIIYQCFCNPVYSDFEDYAMAVPMVHGLVNGRAKVICADQPGNQPAMREAFARLALDNLSVLPADASLLLILSKHGHPFRKETQDKRGHEYRLPLERAMREVMKNRNGKWDLVWSDDEFADEYWDPRKKSFPPMPHTGKPLRKDTTTRWRLPTDFIAENTDLMFFHAIKKFRAFKEFNPYDPCSVSRLG